MNIHEYLMQVQLLNRKIRNKKLELEEIENMAEGVSAIAYDKDKIQTSLNTFTMYDNVQKIIKTEEEIKELLEKYINKKQEIITLIETLDKPEEYDVIYMLYVQEMTVYKVSVVMNYSYRNILRIKHKALAKLSHNVTLK